MFQRVIEFVSDVAPLVTHRAQSRLRRAGVVNPRVMSRSCQNAPIDHMPILVDDDTPVMTRPARRRVGRSVGSRLCLFVLFAHVFFSGCGSKTDKADDSSIAGKENRQINVNVLIVDDENIGPVIRRQWRSRTENSIELTSISWDELQRNDFGALSGVDVVIYPSYRMGSLIQSGLIRDIDQAHLDDKQFNRREILEFDRNDLVRWGDQTFAVSLGEPMPVLLCRTDVLEKLDRPVPQTWEDFSEIAQLLQTQELKDLPNEVLVPQTDHWPSFALSLRVASAIRSRGKYSTYFDVETMDPKIDSEPFLRALQGWSRDLVTDSKNILAPEHVLWHYVNGRAAMAITPLNRNWLEDVKTTDFVPPTIIAPLPGDKLLYDASRGGWTQRSTSKDISVPLIGTSGLSASVTLTAGTKRTRNGYLFILWLGDKQISSIVGSESPRASMSRKSHLGNPLLWLGDIFSTENADQYANIVRQANDNRINLLAPRIMGRDRYLDELDRAVLAVLHQDANAVEAISSVKTKWNQITDELGRDKQKTAYRKSQGLSQ